MTRTIQVKASPPRLIVTVTPDIAVLIELAKSGIKARDEEESLSFYSNTLGKLLWVIDGHSSVHHNRSSGW